MLALTAALGLALGASPLAPTPIALAATPARPGPSPELFAGSGEGRTAPARPALRQDDGDDYPPSYDDEDEEHRKRFFLSGWAGEAFGNGGSGRSSSLFGGEIAIAFSALDVGIATYGYRSLEESTREWTPVTLLRLTERFKTRGGAEATFGFGAGAGRVDHWHPWFQVALGIRVPLGPLFLGGELAFEQYSLLRLVAGLGLAF